MNQGLAFAAAAISTTVIGILAWLTIRWAWNRMWSYMGRTISTHIDAALAKPLPDRWTGIEAEYQALILSEHSDEN